MIIIRYVFKFINIFENYIHIRLLGRNFIHIQFLYLHL